MQAPLPGLYSPSDVRRHRSGARAGPPWRGSRLAAPRGLAATAPGRDTARGLRSPRRAAVPEWLGEPDLPAPRRRARAGPAPAADGRAGPGRARHAARAQGPLAALAPL